MKTDFLLIGCLLFMFSCAIPQKTINTESNADKNSPEYKLEEARITLSTGDFEGAVDLYLNIYADTTTASVFREEALFNLGMMHSDAAGNVEDYEIALKYLQQLSNEFPRTQFREKTNREIRYIRNQIKRLKQR